MLLKQKFDIIVCGGIEKRYQYSLIRNVLNIVQIDGEKLKQVKNLTQFSEHNFVRVVNTRGVA